jgi:serine protease Do
MGLSFAVPINLAMQVAAELRATGTVRRARLGAEFQEITPMLAQSFGLPDASGALIVKVEPGSPAQRAGLRAGDAVRAVDGRRLAHFSQLVQEIAARAPGTRSSLQVWRAGATLTVSAILSEQSPQRPSAPHVEPQAPHDGFGLSLSELSALQRRQLGVDSGLLVRESAGLARSEGIRAGDVVLAINEHPLDAVEEFRRIVSGLPPGHAVALLIMRDRRLAYVPVRSAGRPRAS